MTQKTEPNWTSDQELSDTKYTTCLNPTKHNNHHIQGVSLLPKLKYEMENKEVQTDFPATMLEEYILENRRRVLKLLRYPQQGGGGKLFKDLNPSNIQNNPQNDPNLFSKGRNSPSSPKNYHTRLGLCENMSSSAECLTPPNGPKKRQSMFCHQLSQPSPISPNILDSSNLAHNNRQQFAYRNVPRSTHPYTKSVDSQDIDTINFQPVLNKPPRNLALSVYDDEKQLLDDEEGKVNKNGNNTKSNHVRFASDGGVPLAQTKRPTSCLSLGKIKLDFSSVNYKQ